MAYRRSRSVIQAEQLSSQHDYVKTALAAYRTANGEKERGGWGDNEDDPVLERIERWRSASGNLISRVLSVLGEDSIPVTWSADIPFAATNGEEVMLSLDWFVKHILPNIAGDTGSTSYNWGELKAFSYHELSHILWTPRAVARPTKDILSMVNDGSQPYAFRAYNILEDQRIESLFVARYRPATKLFTHIVSKYIASSTTASEKSAGAQAHLLCHGRKYLPKPIRDLTRAAMIHYITDNGYGAGEYANKLCGKFEAVIDEYRTLVFPTDADRAVELITKFIELLSLIGLTPDNIPDTSSGEQGHSNIKKGRTQTMSEQRRDQERREEADDEADDDDDSDDDDGDDDGGEVEGEADDDTDGEGGKSTNGTGSAGKDDGSDGDGDADGNGDAGEANSESSVSTTPGSGGSNSDTSHPVTKALEELRDLAKDSANAVKQEGADTAKAIRKAIDSAGSVVIPTINDTAGAASHEPTGWMRSAAGAITEQIARIFSDHEEAWINQQTSGRLNIGEAMNARGTRLDIFDVWQDANEEALSFEVVILLDRSASMTTNAFIGSNRWDPDNPTLNHLAYQSMWTIRSAFQSLEIPVTVLGYSTNASMLSTSSTLAKRGEYSVLPTQDSTTAGPALRWARQILQASTAHNRLLITISDGEWSYYHGDRYCDEYVQMTHLAEMGVKSLLFTIGPTYADDDMGNAMRERYGEVEPVDVSKEGGKWYGHDEHVHLNSRQMKKMPAEIGKRIINLTRQHAALV